MQDVLHERGASWKTTRRAKKALCEELIAINQRLLESILVGDWETYATLCDPSITAFEPEARGELVQGLDFHGFYFDQGGVSGPHNTTMASPHVRHAGRRRGRGLLRAADAADGRRRQGDDVEMRRDARVASHVRRLEARPFPSLDEQLSRAMHGARRV